MHGVVRSGRNGHFPFVQHAANWLHTHIHIHPYFDQQLLSVALGRPMAGSTYAVEVLLPLCVGRMAVVICTDWDSARFTGLGFAHTVQVICTD